ncbi:type II secretion system F family protein [Clostridium thermobutyricum]|uniref:type II secretion system F family protein n=1 Tax=Clostridium thermobutyricum TaxID=29372 RepID=UPI003F52784D
MINIRSYENITLISENLSKLYKDGINIVLAFELMLDLPLKKRYKESLLCIKKEIEKGNSIWQSFNKFKELYPAFFINMIKIAEKTGKLSEVLNGLSKYYKSKYEYRKGTIISCIYPSLIFIFLILFSLMILYFIIPSFKELLEGKTELNLFIKGIINFSNFLNENKILGLLSIINFFIVFPIVFFALKWNEIKTLLFKKIKRLNFREEYEIVLILNLFIESGVNLVKGIDFYINSKEIKNKEELIKIKKSIMSGKTISESLEELDKIGRYSLAMIKIGEESGSLDIRLNAVVKNLEEKNEQLVKWISSLVQPILICTLGLMLILFIGTFFIPVMDSIYGVTK